MDLVLMLCSGVLISCLPFFILQNMRGKPFYLMGFLSFIGCLHVARFELTSSYESNFGRLFLNFIIVSGFAGFLVQLAIKLEAAHGPIGRAKKVTLNILGLILIGLYLLLTTHSY